ncbi:protein FAM171B-like [Ambystoma mexicanum]|uniref:protein FAM171B-like n=1 Tax=Ambystoma mexicanum TaxID=8296 RepID=UPI0037E908D4
MAGAHHTAFLLAILIGILLLLFVACVLLLCYCREQCTHLGRRERKRRMRDRLTKEQATSMTCVSTSFLGPPGLSFYGPQSCQTLPCPLMQSLTSQQEDHETSCNTFENWATQQIKPQELDQQAILNSELPPPEKQECESIHDSTSYCMFSSCPSLMESGLKNGRPSSRRCSSSMQSQAKSELLPTYPESTIPSESSLINHMRPTSQQEHCASLSEKGIPQYFSWRSSTLTTSTLSRTSMQRINEQNGPIELSNDGRHSESVSVPGTLKRASSAVINLESNSSTGQSLVQLPKPQCLLSPKAWFIFLGNNSLSEGARICKDDVNNVTSLDSGVDIIELQVRPESRNKECGVQDLGQHEGPLEQSLTREVNCDTAIERLHCSGPVEYPATGRMEEEETGCEQQTAHTEAALKLNQVHYGNKRSLWQKREERPLIGIN